MRSVVVVLPGVDMSNDADICEYRKAGLVRAIAKIPVKLLKEVAQARGSKAAYFAIRHPSRLSKKACY